MKIITVNLSEPHVKALKMLQDLGLYPSRSEAIRVAIRDFLQEEFGFTRTTPAPVVVVPAAPARQPAVVDAEGTKREITRLLRALAEDDPLDCPGVTA